jgi:hypothetical protein
MSKGLYTVLAVVLVLVIAAGSFYGGMLFGKSQAVASAIAQRAAFAAGNLPPGAQAIGASGEIGARGNRPGNMVMGTIKEIGDGSLILTDANGKDTQVKVTDTTLIEKNASVKLTDLAPGEMLMVSGSAAADGTITARSLQVAPQGRFGPGGANRAPGDPNAPAAQPTPAQ